ncbi:MAG: murein endopeptidase [Myxococcota bacterium]
MSLRVTARILAPVLILTLVSPVEAYSSKRTKQRRLRHPEAVFQLQSIPGIHVRNGIRAFGTEKAVCIFEKAVSAVRACHAGTHDIFVGDLSWRGGGKMRPHASHRDGRDIDVGYYFKEGGARSIRHTAPAALDATRTWALLDAMISTGQVEYVFVWYSLQKPLYQAALKSGRTPAELAPIFQYPRTAWNRRGIIRHLRGHNDHFHVRFTPGPHKSASEEKCESSSSSVAAPRD